VLRRIMVEVLHDFIEVNYAAIEKYPRVYSPMQPFGNLLM
tara:strand:+ start:223 stop:342 length:120 start_codon:yes stop_codon:yes gene_type:complete